MDRGAAIFGTALFGIVAGLTWVASSKVGEPDINGAVAAAISSHMEPWVGAEGLSGANKSLPLLVICLESDMPLQVDDIADDLSKTVIKPVPMNDCTSETIEGDFGMFWAITKYFDASGEQVAHLEVAHVSCSSTKWCVVDIDDFGSGHRYMMERRGQEWLVAERTMRWVV